MQPQDRKGKGLHAYNSSSNSRQDNRGSTAKLKMSSCPGSARSATTTTRLLGISAVLTSTAAHTRSLSLACCLQTTTLGGGKATYEIADSERCARGATATRVFACRVSTILQRDTQRTHGTTPHTRTTKTARILTSTQSSSPRRPAGQAQFYQKPTQGRRIFPRSFPEPE